MKRIVLYMALTMAVLCVPVQRTDVGKLRPVQAISLQKEGKICVLETDTGDRGEGTTAMEAMENLKATTPAVIYLDTAEFLLMGEDTEEELEQLRGKLKPSIKLCTISERMNLKKAAVFLRVHQNLPRLKVWEKGDSVPKLGLYKERFIFL